ncbi:MAG: DUF58 domain-containing protein [Proteobacteria bacterium]|jgi:uncharacterized protein (DUF58 family)|nr:DUF58 domain-containing protein [Pseudomonadota bacterium]NBP15988.1 DUF58 domain-containing protein [bacterium]
MKLTQEVLNKIKQIEIQTRRLLSGTQVGDYSSAQKGSGLEFDQLREYQLGDDVRFIDWNASARTSKVLVKQYIEERNRTIILLVDQSASTFYSSEIYLKSDVIAQVASVLALVADYGKDHVGALLFADQVKQVIPPRSGRKHVHSLMESFFSNQPSGKTSLKNALERLIAMQKKDAIVFILSDFFDTGYENLLKIAARKFDVIAIRCLDQLETHFNVAAFLTIKDPETHQQVTIKTSAQPLHNFLQQEQQAVAANLRACGVELIDIQTNRPFIPDIIRFFKRRMMY